MSPAALVEIPQELYQYLQYIQQTPEMAVMTRDDTFGISRQKGTEFRE